jgi:trimeric autotransporter adhesin
MKKVKFLFLIVCLLSMDHAKAQSSWLLGGNINVSDSFIGTQDDEDVLFERNGIQSGRLEDWITHSGTTSWGVGAVNPAVTGVNNIGIGAFALNAVTSGAVNVAVGAQALLYNTKGFGNTAVGCASLFNTNGTSSTIGSYNTGVGYEVLSANITGYNNTAIGRSALFATTGSSNTGIGPYAGYTNRTGTFNTLVGDSADVNVTALTNATAIGADSKVGHSNCVILGGTGRFAVNIGVGVTIPDTSALLDLTSTNRGLLPPRISLTATNSPNPLPANVAGMILYNTATAGTSPYNVTPGYYYNNGSAWVRLMDFNSSGWNLSGNAGTTAGTNFMGTTDNEDVVLKRDNVQSGLIDSSLQNTSWGEGALNPSTTGSNTVAVGYNALHNNTIGGDNTGIGVQALYLNTTGGGNSAVGYYALYSNTSGSGNVANGLTALYFDSSGSYNTANGQEALYSNRSGSYNTASGEAALNSNTTGNDNIGVGFAAAEHDSTGNQITAVGYEADVSADGYTNATVIGAGALVSGSNTIQLGNTSVTTIEGEVPYTHPSDARFKYNIKPSTLGLDFIKQLKPVVYNFDTKKFDEYLMQNIPDSAKEERMKGRDYTASSNIVRTGFLAQDVETICKKNGYYFDGLHVPDPSNKTDHYSLAYSQFVMPLVNAVQELSSKNDSLQNANTQQQQRIDTLQQQFNDLKNIVSQMQFAMTQCCNSFASSMQSATLSKPAITNSELPSLSQNAPNPYSTSTIISYYLPPSTASAQLLITDINGQTLKTVGLNGTGNGQVTINAGTLTSGSYFYTLIVDGQKIDTKQMVLTR